MLKQDHVIKIYSVTEIQANTIVELETYDLVKQAWKVKIPDNNGIAFNKLVVTQNLLHNNGHYRGFGQYGDGFYTIKTSASLSAGEIIGSLAQTGESVFLVLYVSGEYKICRPIMSGGSSGGNNVYKLCKVVEATMRPTAEDPTGRDYYTLRNIEDDNYPEWAIDGEYTMGQKVTDPDTDKLYQSIKVDEVTLKNTGHELTDTEWWSNLEEIRVEKIFNYKWSDDYHIYNFFPQFAKDDIVEVFLYTTEGEGGADDSTDYYINGTFTYAGKADESTLTYLEDDDDNNILSAVFT
jgi:hypothetical protein